MTTMKTTSRPSALDPYRIANGWNAGPLNRAGLCLGCATILVLACVTAHAQQWRTVSEDLGRVWAFDASSVSRVDDKHIRVWMQLSLAKSIQGPGGARVKYVRGLWRINCRDGWYEHIADDARSEDEVRISGGPTPPDRISREYPRPGEPSIQVVRTACLTAAK